MATLKDFLVEADTYQYSKEHYDMMKECSEIMLMGSYLENQYFMAENTEYLESNSESLSEGYLCESATDDNLAEYERVFEERVGNIGAKIKNGFLRIIKTIRNLFVKLANKFDADTKTINSLKSNLNKSKIDASEVTSTLESIAKKYGIVPGDGFSRKIKIGGVSNPLLALALSTDYVLLKSNGNTEKNKEGQDVVNNGAVSYKKLVKIINLAFGDRADVISAQKLLKDAMTESYHRGIEINVNGAKLSSIVKELESLEQRFTTKEASKKAAEDLYANMADEPGETGKRASDMNQLYSILVGAVSSTCKLYTNFSGFRHEAVTELSKLLTRLKPAEPKKDEPLKGDVVGADGETVKK